MILFLYKQKKVYGQRTMGNYTTRTDQTVKDTWITNVKQENPLVLTEQRLAKAVEYLPTQETDTPETTSNRDWTEKQKREYYERLSLRENKFLDFQVALTWSQLTDKETKSLTHLAYRYALISRDPMLLQIVTKVVKLDPYIMTEDGQPMLMYCRNPEMFYQILQEVPSSPECLERISPNHETLLHRAINLKDPSLVQLLLDQDVNPNLSNITDPSLASFLQTPLDLAISLTRPTFETTKDSEAFRTQGLKTKGFEVVSQEIKAIENQEKTDLDKLLQIQNMLVDASTSTKLWITRPLTTRKPLSHQFDTRLAWSVTVIPQIYNLISEREETEQDLTHSIEISVPTKLYINNAQTRPIPLKGVT